MSDKKEATTVPQPKPNKFPLSTELFKDKNIPAFLRDHTLFRNPPEPIQVHKVFRSIGLPNFSDTVKIDKPFDNIKKEGSYVFNLLITMSQGLENARDAANNAADKLQYLSSKEDRLANRNKISDLYILSSVLDKLVLYTNPHEAAVINGAIHSSDGKVVLRLLSNIVDNKDKPIFKKDQPLFSIFNTIKEKCESFNLQFINLEQTQQFKTFCKENMPNKEYSVVFSSEGTEGAWDIATMSMRGIKSCQRWDGEYPRCLIGSILSRFVGIIYLTSGVQAENHPSYPNLGTKMIRRCVVRYAVDADEKAPCILIDKMYPEYDKEVCDIFTKSLRARTKLPVYYAPELGNKIRHIYLPSEEIRNQVSNRDWSYQDTALKSKNDLNVYYLQNGNKEEIERDIKGFKSNLPLFVARKMEEIYTGNLSVEEEIKKTVNNIRMNIAFTPFCDALCTLMMNNFSQTDSKPFKDSKSFYRKYLMDILMNRKKHYNRVFGSIKPTVQAHTSREVNMNVFTTYIYSLLAEFIKLEIKKVIS